MNRGRHRKIIDVFYQAVEQFKKIINNNTNNPLLYHIRADYKYSDFKSGSISSPTYQNDILYTLATIKNFIKKNVANDSNITLTLYKELTPISKITGKIRWKD